MSLPVRVAVAAMLLFVWTSAAIAFDDTATDAAFDALLSMPQAQPSEGDWGVEVPDGYDGKDEAALIHWLARQRKLGADFNQYRHKGTLLQHAMRSRLDSTALWLLRHGADPTLALRETEAPDALGFAILQGQWHLVDALLKLPAFARLSPEQRTARYYLLDPTASDELVKRGFAPLPAGRTADCLLEHALEQGQLKFALSLPSHAPLRFENSSAPQELAKWCNVGKQPYPNGTEFATLDPRDIEALDAKLDVPLLPYLLATLRSAQDVDALFRLPLKAPSDPAQLSRWLLPWLAPAQDSAQWAGLLALPPAVRKALLDRAPTAHIDAAFGDAETLHAWLHLAATGTTDDFAWALAKVPDGALAAHPLVAARSLVSSRNTAALWPLLLARTSLRLDGDETPGLLAEVPMASWPALFERGYRLGTKRPAGREAYPQDEIDAWLANATPEALRQGWPLLKAQMPALPGEGIARLLRQFGINGRPCWAEHDSVMPFDIDKIGVLIELGAQVRPVPLPAACVKHTKPDLYAKLAALGVVAPLDAEAAGRFTFEKPRCRFTPDPAWLSAMATRQLTYPDGQVAIDTVQAIDRPDDDSCVLLVSGGVPIHREYIDDESFLDGRNRLTPCVDGDLAGEVWRLHDGKIETHTFAEGATQGVLPLRDGKDGKRYYLAFSPGTGCGGGSSPPTFLAWTDQTPPVLHALASDEPAMLALMLQCDLFDVEKCLGVRDYAMEDNAPAWDAPHLRDDFIDRFYGEQRKAYLDAMLTLDVPRLRQLEQDGVAPHWTLYAIEAVSKSDLSVPEKRRRTAWLFRDAERLRAALWPSNVKEAEAADAIVLGLGTWLPREDWRPLLAALKVDADQGDLFWRLKDLARNAQAQGNPALACHLLRASGEACKESAAR